MTSTASFPIAAALLVGALLAGCGRSSGGGVTQQAFHRALKAAACMRADGSGEVRKSNRTAGRRDPLTHRVRRCMRTHGVKNFPYPTAQGHVSVEMVEAAGINPQSPAVARVEASACRHGSGRQDLNMLANPELLLRALRTLRSAGCVVCGRCARGRLRWRLARLG